MLLCFHIQPYSQRIKVTPFSQCIIHRVDDINRDSIFRKNNTLGQPKRNGESSYFSQTKQLFIVVMGILKSIILTLLFVASLHQTEGGSSSKAMRRTKKSGSPSSLVAEETEVPSPEAMVGSHIGCVAYHCCLYSHIILIIQCMELVPDGVPVEELGFDVSTCSGEFWTGDDVAWITEENAEYAAFLPVCLCVMYAKDCFLQAVTTYVDMYGLAKMVGKSDEEALVFANGVVDVDCIAYSQTYLSQSQSDDQSNDS